MKKALSIILCLSMLMSMFPMSVFAAPGALPIGGETAEEVLIDVTEADDAQQDAEGTDAVLDAEGTVLPLKVLPKNGETVDYRYPVAYYTFGKDVVINAEEVTKENINNSNVGGVYFDEAENTVWIFPKTKAASYGATISFSAWTSNITTENGLKLAFPEVSFKVGSTPADDGENLVPFGTFEHGWTPFYFDTESASTLEYIEEKDGSLNGVGLLTAKDEYSHNYTRVIYKPGTTYKIEYKAKFAGWQNADSDGTTYTLTPDVKYQAKYFCYPCKLEQTEKGADGTLKRCDKCGEAVSADHRDNFEDHPVNDAIVSGASITGDWVSKSDEFTTRSGEEFIGTNVGMMKFSLYSEPGYKAGAKNGGTSFYIDDVAIYEKVNMTFSAVEGKTALISAAPATLYGYNGDKVTLPTAADYFTTSLENYKVEGWTDGKDVYADGAELTVKGCKVLNPVLVPTGEAVTVTFAQGFAADSSSTRGMPDPVVVKGKFTLPKVVPTRTGFHFEGWVTELGGDEFVTEAEIHADTTFYAKWAKLLASEEFDSRLGDMGSSLAGIESTTFENGCAKIVYDGAHRGGVKLESKVGIFGSKIKVDDIEYVEVRFRLENYTPAPGATGTIAVYVQGTNPDGSYTKWDEGARTDYKYDYNLATGDDFITVRLPRSWHSTSCFKGNLIRYRIQFNNNYVCTSQTVVLDYIRFVGKNIDNIDVTDIEVPVTKAQADLSATAVQNEEFAITGVEWSPALLGGMFYDSATEYSVTVTVEALGNGYMPGAQIKATVNGNEATYKSLDDKTATLTYKFAATEDHGKLKLAKVILNEKSNDGAKTVTHQIIAGDDFDLSQIAAENVPDGYRWMGWSETKNGTEAVGVVNIAEDTNYYAIYELVEEFDFSNSYHAQGMTANSLGALEIKNGWAVVTPTGASDDLKLMTPVTYLKAADFGKIEVIYDGTLKTTVGGKVQANQFGEDATPSLFFTVAGSNTQYKATLVSVDPVVADKRVSYKYTYDMMESAEWKGTIGQIILDPYDGHPAWAVKSITFVRNEDIEEAAVITGVDLPKVWGTPDTDVAVEGNFEVVSVDWGTNLNESGKFKPATAYTVTVVLKPKSGYKIVKAQATVDGKEATATINADGTMTVSYGYAATEALVDFDLTMEGGIIDVADATLKLTPVFTPKVEGETVTVKDVIWEIVKNGDNGKSAKIAEDGTITAVYNGTITVKATSVYNPEKSVEADVVITNQVDDYTITYVAGADGVTNMPAPEYNKGEHTLSTKVPVRDGFTFVGWSRTPGAIDGITKDVITSDTNFYALWIKGYAWEANSSSDFLAFENARKEGSKFVDGVAYIVPNSASKIMISDNSSNVTGKKIPTKEYNQLQVKISVPAATELKLYIQSKDENGTSEWSENASMKINGLVANKPGEFQIVTFDLSNHEQFNLYTYVQQIRLDCSISTSQEIAIDWIRFAKYETGDVQIDGIDTPVAKAVADTDAESLTDSIKVVGVEWLAEDKDPALLYDYYFDGETEYTAAVTVTGAAGFFISANPTVCEINGEKADSFKYNEDGTLTVYKKFPATEAVESSEAYELKLIGLDDNFEEVAETRTIFSGESFALGEYVPTSVPTGYRWIGWVAEGSEEFVGDIVVSEAATYYAQYEVLNQFDYSNPTHWLGTVDKNGEDTIVFKDNLAIVEVEKGADSALVTPEMNINAEDYYRVEIYYDTKLEETRGVNTYPNRMDSTSTPDLKFTTDTNTAYTKAVLVDSSRITLDGQVVQKYVYDVSSVANWTGKIGKLYVDPYSDQGEPYYGLPKWGVRLIKLIPTTAIDEALEVKGVVAPEAWAKPESVIANATYTEGYEFVDVSWTPALNAEGAFLPETAYTATLTYKAESGYKITKTDVVIDDNYYTAVENEDGTYTVSVTFEATGALEEAKVVISGDTVIDEAGRYVELTGKAVAADGTALANSNVTWSIDNENVARISETGRVYPLINGTVTVTATSVYNPSVSATHTIEISNQDKLFTVIFNANTQDKTVQGVNTDPVMTRGNFVPEGYFTRDGYFFMGWTTDEDSLTTSKSFNITSDTVLYAVWGKGLAFEFDDDKKLDGLYSMSKENYNKDAGLFEAVNSGTDPQVNLEASLDDISGKTHPVIQIRIKSDSSNLNGSIYFESVDKAGNYLGHPFRKDPDDYVNNRVGMNVTNTGDFVDISFNMAAKSDWQDGYITAVRYDPFEFNTGATIILDYIRFLKTVRTVTFDGNGGEIPFGSEGDTIISHEVKDVALGEYTYSAVPVRDGYTFLGWSKNPESYDKLYGSKLPVVDDVTFYAMWSIAPKLDNIDDAAINDIVSIVENEVPADMTVTSGDEGITITSPTEAITPVIKLADEIVVSEANHVLVLYLEYDYEEVHDGTIYLSFNMNGQPQRAPIAEDLGLTSGGLHKLIVDINNHVETASLMAEPGETTITDVEVHLQHGIVNEYDVKKILVTTEENANNLASGNEGATEEPDIAGGNNSTPGGTGIGTFPSVGGGSVGSQTGSTVVTPTPKPAAPQGGTTPSTPAVVASTVKFPFVNSFTSNRFVDVKTTDWFYGDVEKSYKIGLMNGKSVEEFVPNGTLTLAEAITVSARLNAIYNGKTIPAATANQKWYDPYVTYAISAGIIKNGQFADYTALATRSQVAVMFANAMPAAWYKQMNMFTSIPDVPSSDSAYKAILTLYNAGVIIGVDDNYNFSPASNIKRSEISAIINRVAIADSRIRVYTEAELEKMTLYFDADELANVSLSGCAEKTLSFKDGVGYGKTLVAEGKNPDPIVHIGSLISATGLDASLYKSIEIGVVFGDDIPAGTVANIFFTTADISWSEKAKLDAKYDGKKDANGVSVLTFNCAANANWKNKITSFRFDPFSKDAQFGVAYIKLVPTVD